MRVRRAIIESTKIGAYQVENIVVVVASSHGIGIEDAGVEVVYQKGKLRPLVAR
jgi:hypothetical protein